VIASPLLCQVCQPCVRVCVSRIRGNGPVLDTPCQLCHLRAARNHVVSFDKIFLAGTPRPWHGNCKEGGSPRPGEVGTISQMARKRGWHDNARTLTRSISSDANCQEDVTLCVRR
jgi:hypothetical protein